jgi:hypothetical protein
MAECAVTRFFGFQVSILALTVCIFGGDSYVPNNDSARSPLDASLKILGFGNVVIEELEQILALLYFEPVDAASDCSELAWSHKQRMRGVPTLRIHK